MRHFRTNHLKAEHVGIVPERGYDNAANQSLLALKFLEWYGEENNVSVQTCNSASGEKRYIINKKDFKKLSFKDWDLPIRWVG